MQIVATPTILNLINQEESDLLRIKILKKLVAAGEITEGSVITYFNNFQDMIYDTLTRDGQMRDSEMKFEISYKLYQAVQKEDNGDKVSLRLNNTASETISGDEYFSSKLEEIKKIDQVQNPDEVSLKLKEILFNDIYMDGFSNKDNPTLAFALVQEVKANGNSSKNIIVCGTGQEYAMALAQQGKKFNVSMIVQPQDEIHAFKKAFSLI